ncbi:MAG: hypothetical protein ABEH66_08095 [Halobacteriales archaeon]
MSAWIEPFGFTKNELFGSEDDMIAVAELDTIALVVLVAIDVVTLPLAALRLVGIGTGG